MSQAKQQQEQFVVPWVNHDRLISCVTIISEFLLAQSQFYNYSKLFCRPLDYQLSTMTWVRVWLVKDIHTTVIWQIITTVRTSLTNPTNMSVMLLLYQHFYYQLIEFDEKSLPAILLSLWMNDIWHCTIQRLKYTKCEGITRGRVGLCQEMPLDQSEINKLFVQI